MTVGSEVSEAACIQLQIHLAKAVTLGIGADIKATTAISGDGATLQLAATGSLTLDVGPLVFKVAGAVTFELAATYLLPWKVAKPISVATMIIRQFAKDLMQRFLKKNYAGASGKNEATTQVDLAMTAQKILSGHASIAKGAFKEASTPEFAPYPGSTSSADPKAFYRETKLLALSKFVIFYFEYHKELRDSAEKLLTTPAAMTKWGPKRNKADKVEVGGRAAEGKKLARWLETAVFMKHFMPDLFKAKPKKGKSFKDLLAAFPDPKENYDGLTSAKMECAVAKKAGNIAKGEYTKEQYLELMVCIAFKYGLFFTTTINQPAGPVEEVPEVTSEPNFGSNNPFDGKEGGSAATAFVETNKFGNTAAAAAAHRAKRQFHLSYKKIDRVLSSRASDSKKATAFIELDEKSQVADMATARIFPSLATLKGNPKDVLGEALARMFEMFSYPAEGKDDYLVFANKAEKQQLAGVGSLEPGKLSAFAMNIAKAMISDPDSKQVLEVLGESDDVIKAFFLNSDGSMPAEAQRIEVITTLASKMGTSVNLLKLNSLMMEPGTFGVLTANLDTTEARFAPTDATFTFAWSLGVTVFQANNFCKGNGPMVSYTKQYLYEYDSNLAAAIDSGEIPEDQPCTPVEPKPESSWSIWSYFGGEKAKAAAKNAKEVMVKVKKFVSAKVNQQNWKYLGKSTQLAMDFFQDGAAKLTFAKGLQRGQCGGGLKNIDWSGIEVTIELRVGGELPDNLQATAEDPTSCKWDPDPTKLYEFWQCSVGKLGIPPVSYGGAGKVMSGIGAALGFDVKSGSSWGVDITLGLGGSPLHPHLIEVVVVTDTVTAISGTVPVGLVEGTLTGSWTSTATAVCTLEYSDDHTFSIRRSRRAIGRLAADAAKSSEEELSPEAAVASLGVF